MTDVETALSDGRAALDDLVELLVVPVLVSLLNVGGIQRALQESGGQIGLRFPFPTPIGDLWSFVETSGTGVNSSNVFTYGLGMEETLSVVTIAAVSFVIYGLVGAGYVGSIAEYHRRGAYDFLANVRAYGWTYLWLTALVYGTFLLLFLFASAMPGVILLAIPVVLIGGYLFWGAWFIVPVAGVGVIEALATSYRYATAGGPYLIWSIVHVLLGAALSLVATVLVMGTGVPIAGIVLGTLVVAPVGFVLTAGSVSVVAERYERQGRTAGQSPDDGASVDPTP